MKIYPKEILPQLHFINPFEVEVLSQKMPALTVVRRCDEPVQFVGIRGAKRLSENCITSDENTFGFSMNLLGGGFDAEEHLGIRQKGRGCEYWDGETVLEDDEIETLWEEVDAYPLYFLAKDLIMQEVPYHKNITKGEYNRILENTIERYKTVAIDNWESKDTPVTIRGFVAIAHAPTMMNYWHVELNVLNTAGESINKGKGKWRDEVRSYVINMLRSYALSPDKVVSYSIPEEFYIKGEYKVG